MNKYPKSVFEKEGGLVYFPRMLDKLRLKAAGKLDEDYFRLLGIGFDGRTCEFLSVDYAFVVECVETGLSDSEVLEKCFSKGRKPSESEIFIWSEFMRKRGWHDDGFETLQRMKGEANMSDRNDLVTFFKFIEADEGRERQYDVDGKAFEYPSSAYTLTERLVWFSRMCSKIRLKDAGLIHPDYFEYIGVGFDGRCCRLLKVDYADVKRLVLEGKEPLEVLEWCYKNGYRPNDEEVFIFNLFMQKRGWQDDDSDFVQSEKESIGLGDREDIQTFFEFYEYDEKRKC